MSEDEERPDAGSLEASEPSDDEEAGEDFTAWDEYDEAFGKEPVRRVLDAEGLPAPVVDDVGNEAHAPVFTEENFVCIADTRAFVIRDDWGQVMARFEPDEVEHTPNGDYRVPTELALERVGDNSLLGVIAGGTSLGRRPWTSVQPVRPTCRHLIQRLNPPGVNQNLTLGWLERHCSVRRTTSGAFLRLTDEAVRACSAREPYDVESSALITRFNAIKIDQGRARTYHSLFNIVSDEILGLRNE